MQILNKNFELAQKEIDLAKQVERDLAEHLIADALENAVSAFDGFGRETCRIHAPKSSDPAKAENLSFQNLARADKHIHDLFGTDLSASVDPKEWDFAWRCFQKRHLLAHKMGVVDEEYVEMTKDPAAVVGRKVTITPEEVVRLIRVLKVIGSYLVGQVSRSKPAF